MDFLSAAEFSAGSAGETGGGVRGRSEEEKRNQSFLFEEKFFRFTT